ncbi:MAG TPA: RsmE family RNA methyltransferase [Acidobacteriota bacterium]
MRTLFAEPDRISDGWIELDQREFHHARDVLRVSLGETVRVSNGKGTIYEGVLDPAVGGVRVERVLNMAASHCEVVLGVALIKGDRWDWLLEKAVEIGVAGIVPLVTSRGIAKVAEQELEKKRDRWRQIMISALKQSGQAFLPDIEFPNAVHAFCTAALPTAGGIDASWILSERGGTPLKEALRPDLKRSRVMVGPEGGWSDSELRTAQEHGFQPVSLGRQILRAETAPIYALSVIRFVTE